MDNRKKIIEMEKEHLELLTNFSIYLSEKGKLTPKEAVFYVSDYSVNNSASTESPSISSNENMKKKCVCNDIKDLGFIRYGICNLCEKHFP